MKNLIFISLFILGLAFMAKSQYVVKSQINEESVPGKVKNNFNAKFPDAKVINWYKIGATTYEAHIKNGKQTELVVFDWEGRVGEELIQVKSKEFPKDKKTALEEKYKDLKITHVFKVKGTNNFVVEGENNGKIYQIKP
jgi:hypothetical protein